MLGGGGGEQEDRSAELKDKVEFNELTSGGCQEPAMEPSTARSMTESLHLPAHTLSSGPHALP